MLALLFLYLFPKFLIYVLWCYVGLRIFRSKSENWGNDAFVFGFYRLLLGFGFGFLVFLAAAALESNGGNTGHSSTALEYVLVYLPIRWIEWTFMAVVILPGSNRFFQWFSGLNNADRLWRLGGIAISFLGDASLFFIVKHVEIGRILC
jgi:hypothetical protein